MFRYLYTILTSNNPNLFFLKLTMIIGILLLGVIVYKITAPPYERPREAFTQSEPFVLKKNEEMYDDFYADIYDVLYNTKKRGQKELIEVIRLSDPSVKHSSFLDIGSGTGHLDGELDEAGYSVYGIDSSKSMVDYASKKYPDVEFIHGDALDTMHFEKFTFTHIICNYFTIYHFQDKDKIFKNCRHWLKPNGFLVLHLVDTNKFTRILPKTNSIINPIEKHRDEHRVIETVETFEDYQCKTRCEVPMSNEKSTVALYSETLIDSETNHVRQNEQAFYMDSMENILEIARKNGFILHGKVSMEKCNGDENQFLYILERAM